MENNVVRAFVLTISLAGFGATTVTAHNNSSKATIASPAAQSGPVAVCLPHDPTHCGMD